MIIMIRNGDGNPTKSKKIKGTIQGIVKRSEQVGNVHFQIVSDVVW
jgi:hypothetical protein